MLQTLANASARATAPIARPATAQRQAIASYGRVSLEARVSTATPHELVLMLYRRLAALLREARDAADAKEPARRLKATERAIAIVEGLDATLYIERGGSVAEGLHQVYDLLRARLLAGDAGGLDEALGSTEAIADAWAAIAPKR